MLAAMAVVATGACAVGSGAGTTAGVTVTSTPATSTSATSTPSESASVPATSTAVESTPATLTPGVPAPARILPDHALHPGAVDAAVSAARLCAAGFSTRVMRPPESYTGRIKSLELGGGGSITGPSGTTYTVVGEHLPGLVSDYELDHLIALEIGGNPEDPRNLWMEPWERRGTRPAPAGEGAESKDAVENRLHREVCAGALTLATAQAELAADWETAR